MNWKLPDPGEIYEIAGLLALMTLLAMLMFGPLFGLLVIVMFCAMSLHLENRQ